MQEGTLLRRRLLKSIVVSGGAVVAGKGLPETWSKPLIDAVLLPAHAQTTPACASDTTFSETLSSGELCPAVTGAPVPDPAPFVFNWPGLTPAGTGTLTVTARGDITGNEGPNEEAWRIEVNGKYEGDVGNTNPAVGGPDTATENFRIGLADLYAANGTATVTAQNVAPNGGNIDCDAGIPNTDVTVTLTFPACST